MISKWLILVMVVTNSLFAYGEADCSKYADALNVCKAYVTALEQKTLAQQEEIVALAVQRDELEKELSQATAPPLVPAWLLIVSGVLVTGGMSAIIGIPLGCVVGVGTGITADGFLSK
jgi:hypothetical protein